MPAVADHGLTHGAASRSNFATPRGGMLLGPLKVCGLKKPFVTFALWPHGMLTRNPDGALALIIRTSLAI